MLKLLVASSLLLAVAFGQGELPSGGETSGESVTTQTPTTTRTRSNYYLALVTALYFPFAVDQCSSYGFGSGFYIKPRCVDTTHIAADMYSSSNCSAGSLSSTQTYNSSTATFRCDGVSTSYSQIFFGASASSCTTAFYAALDVCFQYSPSNANVYSSISCVADYVGTLKTYNSNTCAGTATTAVLNTTCQYVSQISPSLSLYGQMGLCNSASSVTTTSGSGTTTTSSSGTTTTSSSGTTTTSSSGTTTTSSSVTTTTATTSGANTFKNVFGFFMMIVCIMVLF